jgi:hypothetical protein
VIGVKISLLQGLKSHLEKDSKGGSAKNDSFDDFDFDGPQEPGVSVSSAS